MNFVIISYTIFVVIVTIMVIRISIVIPIVSHFDTKLCNTAQAMVVLTENAMSLSSLFCKILHRDFRQSNAHSTLTLALDSLQFNCISDHSLVASRNGFCSHGDIG